MPRPRLGANTAPTTQAFGDAPSAGTAGANAALADHRHGMPAAPGGGTPSGAAGGDLSGTYPNPDVLDNSHNHNNSTGLFAVGGELQVASNIVQNSDTGAVRLQSNASHAILIGPKDQTINVPFRIGGTGVIEWGSGAVARDTNLYRSAAHVLKTDDAFVAATDLSVGGVFTTSGIHRVGGTVFPSIPGIGDTFYRTDRDTWFFWDGTRWLCTCPHTLTFPQTTFLSATTAALQRIGMPHSEWNGNIFFETLEFIGYVSTGGTALSASHKWSCVLRRQNAAGVSNTMGTAEIASGTAGNWIRSTIASIGVNSSTVTYFTVEFDYTKTGTPGTLAAIPTVNFRQTG